jgi:Sensors of blue-light using FAD
MPVVQAQPECASPVDQIAYCSLASPAVKALGMISQWQAQAGITGLLMWEGRLLIHWLEGAPEQIEAMWEQVQNDPQQHCVVRLLHRQGAPKRLFADWKMRQTSRQDMIVIVREIKEQASRESDSNSAALQWQHAISTLSILLDPELTRFYAQSASPSNAMKPALEAMA